MKISRSGLKLIKEWSALRMNAYRGSGGAWMIGYGTMRWPSGQLVREGDKLESAEQAEELLEYSLRAAIRGVRCHTSRRLTQNQFDALVSLIYDVKGGPLYAAGLFDLIGAGEMDEAAEMIRTFDVKGCGQAGTRTDEQRIARRKREAQIFKML